MLELSKQTHLLEDPYRYRLRKFKSRSFQKSIPTRMSRGLFSITAGLTLPCPRRFG